MNLLALQRDLRAFLLAEDETAATHLGASARPGLSVYLNNYRAQLVTVLEGSFAQTHAWIGDRAFLRAAAQHIDRVPPSSWTLDAYARDFPETLAWLYPKDADIAEIARIELALGADDRFRATHDQRFCNLVSPGRKRNASRCGAVDQYRPGVATGLPKSHPSPGGF